MTLLFRLLPITVDDQDQEPDHAQGEERVEELAAHDEYPPEPGYGKGRQQPEHDEKSPVDAGFGRVAGSIHADDYCPCRPDRYDMRPS